MSFLSDIRAVYSHHKSWSDQLTSYDILKSLALFLMIIDHIGYYFLIDELTFRLIGRLCVPVWAFLIGYSLTNKKDPRLLIGTILFALNSYICGDAILPICILSTFALCRYFLPFMERKMRHDFEGFVLLLLALVVLSVPSALFFQYGTQIFLFALFGRIIRLNQEKPQTLPQYYGVIASIVAILNFALWQSIIFGFSYIQAAFLCAGCLIIIGAVLTKFKSQNYQLSHNIFTRATQRTLMFCGRWTLELYLLNIISFSMLATFLGVEGFKWFTFVLL
ncbi:MAG: conjugal transfer protein TraX [Alphaproteobacteria bacterium]|nr:conjugal transfer protein TraX [Alphaproteobacteria bacterium]